MFIANKQRIMEKKEWKSVIGYEGIYSVSNDGEVRNDKTSRILKPNFNKDGYLRLTLSKCGKSNYCKVHRIVFNAFVGDFDNSLVIDHIDGIKTNNKPENLRQIPTRENTSRAKKRLSNFRGVRYFKDRVKWGSEIKIDGVRYFLGLYADEIDAFNEYQKALDGWLKNKQKPYKPKNGFKVCRLCNKELEFSKFNKAKTKKGNESLKYCCKECEHNKNKKIYKLKKQLL